MKRKPEIVRSLMHRPGVLFLDEPTTGLDPVSRHGVWAYLHDIRNRPPGPCAGPRRAGSPALLAELRALGLEDRDR